jgi:hypothetical protein
MNFARLTRMGVSEIACRSRQAVLKRLDSLQPSRRSPLAGTGVRMDLLPRAQSVRARAASRFFEGLARDAALQKLERAMPEVRGSIIASAEAILRGRFDFLGYRGLSFGTPIDWHLDPVSGRRAPLLHWSRLDPLDPEAVGDSKVVWELNRHQWMVTLAQAYRFTRDEEYAHAVAVHLRDWLLQNPRGLGINWTSSLEAALRIISWSWTLLLLRDSEALTPELLALVLDGLAQHAAHVSNYLSHYFSPNTHLTGEALGLFYAGCLLQELPRAAAWRATAARILEEQCRRQIHEDGIYFEQSTCYQRYTAEIYLHFVLLCSKNGLSVSAQLEERLVRMLDALLALRGPDGRLPQIGDADGGNLLPLVPREPHDVRGVLSVGAALFDRSDYAWAAGGATLELLWLLGESGLERFARLTPRPPSRKPSQLFASGGYAVMRSDWSAEALQLIFDVGPLGCPVSSGHGHADLLSIQCHAFGEPFLVDPGTFAYAADPAWRDYFRSTHAHNTVVVDGLSQAEPARTFAWQRRPGARLLRFTSTNVTDVAEACHDAYARLADPVIHRRRVIFVKPSYFVLIDDLLGALPHRVELRFQFAPLPLSVAADQWLRARGARAGLLLRSFAVTPLQLEVRRGATQPAGGWVSPNYGVKQAAPLASYISNAALPLRVVTLILPLADAQKTPPDVSLVSRGERFPAGIAVRGEPEILFDEATPCAESPASSS